MKAAEFLGNHFQTYYDKLNYRDYLNPSYMRSFIVEETLETFSPGKMIGLFGCTITDLFLEGSSYVFLVDCKIENLYLNRTKYITVLASTIDNVALVKSKGRISFVQSKIRMLDGLLESILDLSGTEIIYPQPKKPSFESVRKFLDDHCLKVEEGYIVYKVFNFLYRSPKNWNIKKGSYITETVDYSADKTCSYGINVCHDKSFYGFEYKRFWRCLLEFADMDKVQVPKSYTNKFRVGRLKLLEKEYNDK